VKLVNVRLSVSSYIKVRPPKLIEGPRPSKENIGLRRLCPGSGQRIGIILYQLRGGVSGGNSTATQLSLKPAIAFREYQQRFPRHSKHCHLVSASIAASGHQNIWPRRDGFCARMDNSPALSGCLEDRPAFRTRTHSDRFFDTEPRVHHPKNAGHPAPVENYVASSAKPLMPPVRDMLSDTATTIQHPGSRTRTVFSRQRERRLLSFRIGCSSIQPTRADRPPAARG